MPTPGKDETEKEFINRCIPIVLEDGAAETIDQAVAMCYQIWEEDRTMTTHFLRAYPVDTGAAEDPSKPVRFVASTEGVKSDGKNLQQERWDLERFKSHPVALWGHDLWGERLPIGLIEVSFEDRKMLADIFYDTDDPFAMRVRGKALKGMVAASVNWDEIERDGKMVNELLEISNVPIPLDPDALAVREIAGLRALRDALDTTLNETKQEPAETPWREVADQMIALFAPGVDDSDDCRKEEYQALLPKYRRLDKEPPEFRTIEELKALTPELVRGLFLAGEFGERLDSRQVEALQSIYDQLGEILGGSDPPEPDAETLAAMEKLEALLKPMEGNGE